MTHNGNRGHVELTVEEWFGTRIKVAFRDRLYQNSGMIELDGKTGVSLVRTSRPYPEPSADYLGPLLDLFSNYFRYGWSPVLEQMPRYDAEYHAANNYIQGDPTEIAIKQVQARIIEDLGEGGKCLVAGCSNGELVRQCRAIGLDAYGFDVIPDIEKIAFPEVRDYLRHGSLAAIPYSGEDGFDTLIAIDVLEHIPERDLPRMIDEWLRIGVQRLILLINLNQFWYPGHVTLRPLDWWINRFKPHFKHVTTLSRFEHLPIVYSNAGYYNQQWIVFSAR